METPVDTEDNPLPSVVVVTQQEAAWPGPSVGTKMWIRYFALGATPVKRYSAVCVLAKVDFTSALPL